MGCVVCCTTGLAPALKLNDRLLEADRREGFFWSLFLIFSGLACWRPGEADGAAERSVGMRVRSIDDRWADELVRGDT